MVKFLDLFKVNEAHRAEIERAIEEVMDSGWYVLGQQCERFERNFATYCGVRHAIGVANGLDALKLIVKAYGFGKGDEIIVPGQYVYRIGSGHNRERMYAGAGRAGYSYV